MTESVMVCSEPESDGASDALTTIAFSGQPHMKELETPSYAMLKTKFRDSTADFAEYVKGSVSWQKKIINSLALAENDNGWPLGMLAIIRPRLAGALTSWSAGGYDEIRRAQEAGSPHVHAAAINDEFHFLPKWSDRVTHVSKDDAWFSVFADGSYQLRSFLSCCGSDGSFAYVSHPAVTLVIDHPKTARLLGALTTENFEQEVIFPNNTSFRLKRMDIASRRIHLIEEIG